MFENIFKDPRFKVFLREGYRDFWFKPGNSKTVVKKNQLFLEQSFEIYIILVFTPSLDKNVLSMDHVQSTVLKI